MCLLLSLGCCGCSSPKSCQEMQKPPEQHQQPNSYHSEIQLCDLPPSLSCQVTTSQPSLYSMSPSLMALPHRNATSSTLSSWAGEEELCAMEDYEDRTSSRWTAWWLKEPSVGDQGCRSTKAT
ncbi:uncharacterized protein LOC108105475 [Drosophila eugracilis]|uniref:uncharacterized protein LOC108105475 n=1 Tax=Drosophila eugracilis TaxID=29029 RepID=UPI0007E89236|nr:uncharacterized protein LOC108105475 [Drosophila eugracilis]